MVPSIHDYSSSEDELNLNPTRPESSPSHSTRRRTSQSSSHLSPTSRSRPSNGADHHRVKLTLRPSLNDLVDTTPTSEPLAGPSKSMGRLKNNSERSSLSPPPPITLRFGIPPKSAMADRARYSSDEEGDLDPRSSSHSNRPSKKIKIQPKSPSKKNKPSREYLPEPTNVAGGHRKSYDWLQPSAVGASHHGPSERAIKLEEERSSDAGKGGDLLDDMLGQELDELENASNAPTGGGGGAKRGSHSARVGDEVVVVSRPKKSKKKSDGTGPGKAWRKGLKKGMAIPWIEGGTFMPDGSIQVTQPAHVSGTATPMSNGTPEPHLPHPPHLPAEPPVPFDAADPEKLGFPVYNKPIQAPKFRLGNFPRVTTWFYQNNGGDVGPFPRKEPVAPWTPSEKTFTGIGGGTLKYKAWVRGPNSELSRLVQADKEAKEVQRREAKANAANAASTPSDLPAVGAWADTRPPLESQMSSESTPTASALEGLAPTPGGALAEVSTKLEEGQEAGSDVGDGEESVVSTPASTPLLVGSGSSGNKKAGGVGAVGGSRSKGPVLKAKLKKSKLAQEIVPTDANEDSTSALDDII